MNQILEEVRVLQNKLKSDHLNYELELNNAKMVCGSSTADVINQIEAKKQSLDDHSESVLKSYNNGTINMTMFVQVKEKSESVFYQLLLLLFCDENNTDTNMHILHCFVFYMFAKIQIYY